MIGKNQAELAGYKMGRAVREAEERAAKELAALVREDACANEIQAEPVGEAPKSEHPIEKKWAKIERRMDELSAPATNVTERVEAAIIAKVGENLEWNVRAYGKAWTGEGEDTAFICSDAAEAAITAFLGEAGNEGASGQVTVSREEAGGIVAWAEEAMASWGEFSPEEEALLTRFRASLEEGGQ